MIWTIIFIIVIALVLVYSFLFVKRMDKIPMSSHEEVYNFPGKTKDELYVETRDWFVETFNDSKSVLEVQDKENGLLKGKGVLDTLGTVYEIAKGKPLRFRNNKAYCNSTFIISVSIKDGKVKIDVKESFREWKPKNMGCNKKQQEAFSQLSALYCEDYKDFIENSNSKADF